MIGNYVLPRVIFYIDQSPGADFFIYLDNDIVPKELDEEMIEAGGFYIHKQTNNHLTREDIVRGQKVYVTVNNLGNACAPIFVWEVGRYSETAQGFNIAPGNHYTFVFVCFVDSPVGESYYIFNQSPIPNIEYEIFSNWRY